MSFSLILLLLFVLIITCLSQNLYKSDMKELLATPFYISRYSQQMSFYGLNLKEIFGSVGLSTRFVAFDQGQYFADRRI